MNKLVRESLNEKHINEFDMPSFGETVNIGLGLEVGTIIVDIAFILGVIFIGSVGYGFKNAIGNLINKINIKLNNRKNKLRLIKIQKIIERLNEDHEFKYLMEQLKFYPYEEKTVTSYWKKSENKQRELRQRQNYRTQYIKQMKDYLREHLTTEESKLIQDIYKEVSH